MVRSWNDHQNDLQPPTQVRAPASSNSTAGSHGLHNGCPLQLINIAIGSLSVDGEPIAINKRCSCNFDQHAHPLFNYEHPLVVPQEGQT